MLNNEQSKPLVLSIAGSDPSGGAGIQADIKTFHSFGVHGLTAITCVTSQVPGKVLNIEPVSINSLKSQVDILFSEYQISAINKFETNIHLNSENIFDTQYQSIYGFPVPGRSYTLTITIKERK